MAFGDKMNWSNPVPTGFSVEHLLPVGIKPQIETIPDCLITLNGTKKCCDIIFNMAVEDNGDCICLKCRRVVGVQHFNRVLGC